MAEKVGIQCVMTEKVGIHCVIAGKVGDTLCHGREGGGYSVSLQER